MATPILEYLFDVRVIQGVCTAFLVWSGKRAVLKLEMRMESLEHKYYGLREELPKEYAEKKVVEKLAERVGKNSDDIAYMKGARNGVTS